MQGTTVQKIYYQYNSYQQFATYTYIKQIQQIQRRNKNSKFIHIHASFKTINYSVNINLIHACIQ